MHILFFEKLGCIGGSRQKAILQVAGHEVETKDLLSYQFSREELLSYLVERPVSEWFNRSAPRVKSGDVQPEALNQDAALDLLLSEPLLIRRPLLEIDGKRCVGFNVDFIEAMAGPFPREERLSAMLGLNLEQCPGEQTGYRCPDANAASAATSSADKSLDLALFQPDHK